MKGLEPPRLSAPDPKSGAATSYATSACPEIRTGCKYTNFAYTKSGPSFTNQARII
jgi:hypothetical protein